MKINYIPYEKWLNFNNDDILEYINNISHQINNALHEISDLNGDEFKDSLIDITNLIINYHHMCNFFELITTNEPEKYIWKQADELLYSYVDEFYINKKLYHALNLYYKNNKLDNNINIFINLLIKLFKKNGVEINEELYEKFKIIDDTIIILEKKLNNHINNGGILTINKKNEIYLNEIIKLFNLSNNDIKLDLKLYNKIITTINDNSSKYVIKMFNSHCSEKYKKIIQLIYLRNLKASIFGFKNHFDMVTSNCILTSSKLIINQLVKIGNIATTKSCDELSKLFKKINIKKKISLNEILFYFNIIKKKIKKNTCKFNKKKVLVEILKLINKLFSITFIKSNTIKKYKNGIIEIILKQNNKILGYLFIDISNENNNFKPKSICVNIKSSYTNNIISIIGFLPENIYYDDIVSLTKEFVKSLHYFIQNNNYALINGMNNIIDFNNVLTNLIDLLMWEETIITKFITSCSITSTDANIKNILFIKDLDSAFTLKLDIFNAMFDMSLYLSEDFQKLIEEIVNNGTEKYSEIFTELLDSIFEQVMVKEKKYISTPINFDPLLMQQIIKSPCVLCGSIIAKIFANKIWDSLNNKYDPRFWNGYINNILPHQYDDIQKIFINYLESFINTKQIQQNNKYSSCYNNIDLSQKIIDKTCSNLSKNTTIEYKNENIFNNK